MIEERSIRELVAECMLDSERWFGDMDAAHNLVHHALALGGEVGEFQNLVKKIDRGSMSINDPATKVKLAEELTDVFMYLLNCIGIVRFDLAKSYVVVRGKNETRFMAERAKREAAKQ